MFFCVSYCWLSLCSKMRDSLTMEIEVEGVEKLRIFKKLQTKHRFVCRGEPACGPDAAAGYRVGFEEKPQSQRISVFSPPSHTTRTPAAKKLFGFAEKDGGYALPPLLLRIREQEAHSLYRGPDCGVYVVGFGV